MYTFSFYVEFLYTDPSTTPTPHLFLLILLPLFIAEVLSIQALQARHRETAVFIRHTGWKVLALRLGVVDVKLTAVLHFLPCVCMCVWHVRANVRYNVTQQHKCNTAPPPPLKLSLISM